MASEAQILANRKNAEKSTGPRTAEGKAVASQNAVTHGLLAQHCVIRTEDPEDFDAFRTQMLEQLVPAAPLETVLAERIVGLSWRLKRVERMQNEALDCLLAEDGGSDELGSFEQTGDPALGRAAVKDFGGERAMERLLVYERRIEQSLYKAVSELERIQVLASLHADERRRYQELAYADSMPGGGRLPTITPCGVTTNKTNPISGGVEAWRAHPAGANVKVPVPADSTCCVTAAG
jgi:hypothetical protein